MTGLIFVLLITFYSVFLQFNYYLLCTFVFSLMQSRTVYLFKLLHHSADSGFVYDYLKPVDSYLLYYGYQYINFFSTYSKGFFPYWMDYSVCLYYDLIHEVNCQLNLWNKSCNHLILICLSWIILQCVLFLLMIQVFY